MIVSDKHQLQNRKALFRAILKVPLDAAVVVRIFPAGLIEYRPCGIADPQKIRRCLWKVVALHGGAKHLDVAVASPSIRTPFDAAAAEAVDAKTLALCKLAQAAHCVEITCNGYFFPFYQSWYCCNLCRINRLVSIIF